ncbi:uncharacterized protein DNG_06900 [Cephalotrichum gorgonifer]|uniref:Uncharacterized protein n=1 Tax=Cephalotrichum gorgonifer TaxID=2041049 RepID=A0AAE8SXR4_9PEZI|nr:uncharacterized protein DNG_06900 [Cephalotrichum gorgonifer]
MRFTPVFAGLVAVAYAADSTTSAEAPKSTALTTEEQKCIAACPASDVNCIAHCTPVPSPSEDNIKALNECVSKCDQGDGSEAQTIAFSNCTQKCVVENYYDPAVGTPDQGSSSSGGSSNGDSSGDSNSNGDSGSSDGEDSSSNGDSSGDNKDGEDKSGEDKSGDDKGNSASGLAASTWGLFGLVAAALAF